MLPFPFIPFLPSFLHFLPSFTSFLSSLPSFLHFLPSFTSFLPVFTFLTLSAFLVFSLFPSSLHSVLPSFLTLFIPIHPVLFSFLSFVFHFSSSSTLLIHLHVMFFFLSFFHSHSTFPSFLPSFTPPLLHSFNPLPHHVLPFLFVTGLPPLFPPFLPSFLHSSTFLHPPLFHSTSTSSSSFSLNSIHGHSSFLSSLPSFLLSLFHFTSPSCYSFFPFVTAIHPFLPSFLHSSTSLPPPLFHSSTSPLHLALLPAT